MENLCEELHLCEDRWKVEQITIDNYSSWHVSWMKKRLFNIILKPKGIKQEADSKTVVSG
jgi:hypothetical protein